MDICEAINNRNIVEFEYEGFYRKVLPVAHGLHRTTRNSVLRGYQVGGSSSSRAVPFWTLFREDKIRDFSVLSEIFIETPRGFSPDDLDIIVHCQLEQENNN